MWRTTKNVVEWKLLHIYFMLTFWEWLDDWRHLLCEMGGRPGGEDGYEAFVDQTNRGFRAMIGTILRMGKFTDPRNAAEAKAIVSDPNYFNYAQELVAAASGERARLQGQDILDGVQEANGRLWMALLNPRLYQAADVTWESKNPLFHRTRGHPWNDSLLVTQHSGPLRRPYHEATDGG
jgi:hypothetical protein